MAATFLRARGHGVGRSPVEDDRLDLARRLLKKAQARKVEFVLPVDAVVADELRAGMPAWVVPTTDIPSHSRIGDIGPGSVKLFCSALSNCRTVLWNGPMGIFEIPQFAEGTRSIASFLSTLNATTVIGGGSTAEVVQEMGLSDRMTHVSTGGGASLRFLEGATLPGVSVLADRD
jgi:phosphoglycerate kinase